MKTEWQIRHGEPMMDNRAQMEQRANPHGADLDLVPSLLIMILGSPSLSESQKYCT
jgi:hypothetical protein